MAARRSAKVAASPNSGPVNSTALTIKRINSSESFRRHEPMAMLNASMEERTRRAQQLSRVPLFRGLEASVRFKLIEVMMMEHFIPGDYIFKQGQIGDKFYIVVEGKVAVSINKKTGRGSTVVAMRKKDEYFGDFALLRDSPLRSANIYVDGNEPVKVLSLSREKYDELLPATVRERMKQEAEDTLATDKMRKKVASMFQHNTDSQKPSIDLWTTSSCLSCGRASGTLRFLSEEGETNEALELQFSLQENEKRMESTLIRWKFLGILAFLVSIFCIFYGINVHGHEPEEMIPLVAAGALGVCVTLPLIVMLNWFRDNVVTWFEHLVVAFYTATLVIIIVLLAGTPKRLPEMSNFPSRLLLPVLVVHSVVCNWMRVRFDIALRWSLVVLLVSLGFMLIILIMDTPPRLLMAFQHAFFFIIGWVINLVSLYKEELNGRQQFHLYQTLLTAQSKSADMLHTILPIGVCDRVMHGERVLDHFPHITIMFCSISHFSDLVKSYPDAEQLFGMLDHLYHAFDDITMKHQLYKVEHVASDYVVASSIIVVPPKQRPAMDTAEYRSFVAARMCELSACLVAFAGTVRTIHGKPPQFKVGLNSGPGVCGVIGSLRKFYRVFGNVINVASRMYSHGAIGRIHMSDATHRLLEGSIVKCEDRGHMKVKGRGMMRTWFVDKQWQVQIAAKFSDSTTMAGAGKFALGVTKFKRLQAYNGGAGMAEDEHSGAFPRLKSMAKFMHVRAAHHMISHHHGPTGSDEQKAFRDQSIKKLTREVLAQLSARYETELMVHQLSATFVDKEMELEYDRTRRLKVTAMATRVCFYSWLAFIVLVATLLEGHAKQFPGRPREERLHLILVSLPSLAVPLLLILYMRYHRSNNRVHDVRQGVSNAAELIEEAMHSREDAAGNNASGSGNGMNNNMAGPRTLKGGPDRHRARSIEMKSVGDLARHEQHKLRQVQIRKRVQLSTINVEMSMETVCTAVQFTCHAISLFFIGMIYPEAAILVTPGTGLIPGLDGVPPANATTSTFAPLAGDALAAQQATNEFTSVYFLTIFVLFSTFLLRSSPVQFVVSTLLVPVAVLLFGVGFSSVLSGHYQKEYGDGFGLLSITCAVASLVINSCVVLTDLRKFDTGSRSMWILGKTVERQNKGTNKLLFNMMPEHIIHRLAMGKGSCHSDSSNVAVLFGDICGFTPLSATMTPLEIVSMLDDIFGSFDELVESFNGQLYKMDTIGDAYVVVGGLGAGHQSENLPLEEYCCMCVEIGLAFQDVLRRFRDRTMLDVNMRIGVHVGPVVAGVIGRLQPRYHIYGGTLNLANVLEATSPHGAVHISEPVAQLVKTKYFFARKSAIAKMKRKEWPTMFPFKTQVVAGRVDGASAVMMVCESMDELEERLHNVEAEVKTLRAENTTLRNALTSGSMGDELKQLLDDEEQGKARRSESSAGDMNADLAHRDLREALATPNRLARSNTDVADLSIVTDDHEFGEKKARSATAKAALRRSQSRKVKSMSSIPAVRDPRVRAAAAESMGMVIPSREHKGSGDSVVNEALDVVRRGSMPRNFDIGMVDDDLPLTTSTGHDALEIVTLPPSTG